MRFHRGGTIYTYKFYISFSVLYRTKELIGKRKTQIKKTWADLRKKLRIIRTLLKDFLTQERKHEMTW